MDMRDVYTQTLIDLAKKDARIVVLEADLMKATGTTSFSKEFPERAINVGVAEANMVGVASGLAAVGKIPFAASFACFAARRTFDQFFLSANYAKLPVHLVGTDPGITAQYNGGTHMPFEDVGLMRTIPDLVVFEPSDTTSVAKLTRLSAEHAGPTYMRLHRKGGVTLYDENENFELGKGKVLRDGDDLTIIAMGMVMVPESLKAADILAEKGIRAAVIDMHTVKPIDEELVVEYAKKTGAVLTCENHQVKGGLGSAVAETLGENYPTLMKRHGVLDEFGEVGDLDYLMERYGMKAEVIAAKAEELAARKKQGVTV